MALRHLQKSTAKTIIWVSASTFIETIGLVLYYPEFKIPVAAGIATFSLVTALVVAFEHFYDHPKGE